MNPSLCAYVNYDFNILHDYSSSGCSMPLFHYHDMYEIYFLKHGSRTLFINEDIYPTNANTVYLLKPYNLHRSEGNGNFEGFCIHFSEAWMDKYFSVAFKIQLLECFSSPVLNLNSNCAAEFKNILEKLLNSKPCNYAVYFPILLNILNQQTSAHSVKINSNIAHGIMPDIIDYINKNFTVIKNIDQLAKKFYLSKNYLGSLFKQQTGSSFIKYINTLKIQFACYRLSSTDYSIQNIAKECGFESTAYFCRIFKKIMGCSPSQYRYDNSFNS